MTYFKRLKSTEHYRDCHEHEVPWTEVAGVIYGTKNPKKKGNKFEIKTKKYYILYTIIKKKAYVINAKRT